MILVDTPRWPKDGRLWCHLVSDRSFDELHAFARSVGIPERGFDGDHYDVPDDRRDAVIAAGAVPVTSRELVTRLTAAGLRRRKPRSAKRRSVRGLVGAFYERLWNAWDDDAVDDVLAPEFRFRGSLGDTTVGRDAWRTYRDQVRAGSADFHNEVLALVVEADRAVARLRWSGTHTGLLLDLPSTGRRFSYEGMAFFEAGDRQLEAAWVVGDLDALRGQLSR